MTDPRAPRRPRRGPATTELLRHAPWSATAWRLTAHVLTGGVVGLLTGGVVLALALLAAGLAVTVLPALGVLLLLVGCVRAFAALHRSRLAAFLGVAIPAPPAPQPGRWPDRLRAGLRSGDTWRQFAYHLFAMPANAAAAAVLAFTWSAGLLLTLAPLHTGLPAGEPGSPARPIPAVLTLVAVGVALLAVAPWLAAGLTAVDLRVARALLGPSRRAELTRRVATLARSRADLVEAADAERRRIERDLHDGMQQRLVALAMNLGLARASFPDAPDPVRDALARSHDDAKQALAELRAVVRGLYPAVLDDRGLDAALSGIVARSPVPARLAVDLHRRPPAQVEAVAYFVVAESLANVAKHARASRVDVRVALPAGGDRLRVSVTDDGRGGARPERGTGLRGLAQRVASVDGSLRVDSPDGGPTTILVELPCGS